MKNFTPFTQGPLDSVLSNQLDQITNKIEGEGSDYLLNVNEDEYIDHLVSEFTVDVPIIDFEAITASPIEKLIPASQHPSSMFFREDMDQSFKRQVIVYHLPFSGDINVLDYFPNPRVIWTQDFTHNDIDCNELTFEVINFSNDPSVVKRDFDYTIGNLKTQMGHIVNQINGYNSNLKYETTQRVQQRKSDLRKKSDFLSNLGVPILKRENVPDTFSVPVPKIPKKIIPRPAVTSSNPNPDPTIDLDTYNEILRIIYDVGRAIERMPSTYRDKTEEDLRDHFLISLEPKFQGSVTGETFNKTGKTDILLRYENSNIFIAECKYWGGEKIYFETLNQILKYLTWRDSKASIIIFVKNADFSSVIKKVLEITPNHPNFMSFDGQKEETYLSYKVSLNGDPDRKLYLTVLLFHFPEN